MTIIRAAVCFACKKQIDLFHDHYMHIHSRDGVDRYWHNDKHDPQKNCYYRPFHPTTQHR